MTARQDRHVGPWADTYQAAVAAALTEVGVDTGDWVTCEHADSQTLVHLDPQHPSEIHVDLTYSEPRDQWKATLHRVPNVREVAEL